MRDAARPGGAVGQAALARGLAGGDEVAHRLPRRVGWHHQHQRRERDAGHGGEVGGGEAGLAVGGGVDRQHAGEAHGQGVAVGWALQQGHHAEVAAGARAVLDHDVLLQFLGQARRHQARGDVGGAARRVGHDDAQRLGREGGGLREGRRSSEERGAQQGGAGHEAGQVHGSGLLAGKVGWVEWGGGGGRAAFNARACRPRSAPAGARRPASRSAS